MSQGSPKPGRLQRIKTSTDRVLEFLQSLPPGNLREAGQNVDLRIVERENATPVGGHQRRFLP